MSVNNPGPTTGGKESLGASIVAFWRELPSKGLFLALLAAWVALFHFWGNSTLGYVKTSSLFGWWLWMMTGGAIEREGFDISQVLAGDEAHAWFVPAVVLALLWWRRKELLGLPQRAWWPALSLLAIGLILHILGYSVQQTRISLLGFFVGIYALVGLTWGPHWLRATFFPLMLLGFCMPLGNAAEAITFPMRMLVTKLSVWTGHTVLGIDVIRDGSRIFDAQHTFQYDVAPACSGIRSLVALLALTTIYGYVTFRTAWKRGLMVLLAFPLAIVGNTLRITCVIIAGEAFGQQAGGMVEQKLGFLTFGVALVAVLALGHWLSDDRPRGGRASEDRPDSAVAANAKAAPVEPTI